MATRGVNKVILLGTLGKVPEIRMSQNGQSIANINIATSETWQDKATGETKEKTEWHRVIIFGKLAEIAGKYLQKGSKVYIEGQLQTRKWQDQNGIERYVTEVVVNPFGGIMQMLGGGQQDSNQQNNGYQQQSQPQNHQQQNNYQQNQPPYVDIPDEDIPF